MVRNGEKALSKYFAKSSYRSKVNVHDVFLTCQNIVAVCQSSIESGTLNEEFFNELQDELVRELRLLETCESESESVACRIDELYRKLHPSDNLRTIPGVGSHTAPVFLACIGDPLRFRNQSAFANWQGVVPGARQSSDMQVKGLRMTKAGPSILRMALYQASEIGRRNDPSLAAIYFRQMVKHGKNHRQAMGAVMSHLGARVLAVLKEDRPYQIRDLQDNAISKMKAKKLIQSQCHVSEEVRNQRRLRRRKVAKKEEVAAPSMNEAANAPQTVRAKAISRN